MVETWTYEFDETSFGIKRNGVLWSTCTNTGSMKAQAREYLKFLAGAIDAISQNSETDAEIESFMRMVSEATSDFHEMMQM